MVKDKPNSIRTYDEDGFRKRAACICVRNELEDEVGKVGFVYQELSNELVSTLEGTLQSLAFALMAHHQ